MNKLFLISVILFFFLTGYFLTKHQNTSDRPLTQAPPISSPNKKVLGGELPFPLTVPEGFHIGLFASGLKDARDLQFSPNGTLLVSSPDSNQVYAIIDKNNDGIADEQKVIITGENHVHGLAFYNDFLYVADVDKVVRYKWDESAKSATKDQRLFTLPENSDHNARTIIFNNGQLYVSVGSTCNVCSEPSNESATVMTSDPNGNNLHVYATGLRNAPFLAVNPQSNTLWATEMGRDNLGDTIPPDEIDSIKQNQKYGWPYCYGEKIHDNNFDPRKIHSCTDTIAPLYQIPAHSAPLGLTFITSTQFPDSWQNDLLVAYHGSWNRSSPIGYKIVHLNVEGESVLSSDDFLTGFLPANTVNGPDGSLGRPVDVTFDKNGNLFISDDKAGNIYIVSKK